MNKINLFIVVFCVLCSASSAASELILHKKDVERLFQEKLVSYQELISKHDISALQSAVKDFMHEETIILFEFSLKMPGMEALPAQKAYFNRDPFINLLKNANSLEPGSFELTYKLNDFQPQYGGGAAIIQDSGTAKGRLNETFSGDAYDFNVSQKCRNTISADAKTMFKVDSIYCRMEIEYQPVRDNVSPSDGVQEAALEKPVIGDIISELEEKKRKTSETK